MKFTHVLSVCFFLNAVSPQHASGAHLPNQAIEIDIRSALNQEKTVQTMEQKTRSWNKTVASACPQTSYLLPRSDQITDYIRVKKPIAELNEITICGWFTTNSGGYMSGTLLSYATISIANSLLIRAWGDAEGDWYFAVTMNNKYHKQLTYPLGANVEYHVCVVITAVEGLAHVYLNGQLFHEFYTSNRGKIEGNGVFLIGQEQDSLAGKFDEAQAYQGVVKNYLVWYRKLTDEEVSVLYNSPCYCPSDYDFALIEENVELYGGAAGMNVAQCVQ